MSLHESWSEYEYDSTALKPPIASSDVQYLLQVGNLSDCLADFPYGLVVRIRRSHRRGPGSIPGVGTCLVFLLFGYGRF